MEIINALRQFLAEFTVLVMTLVAPTPVPLPVQNVSEIIATSTVATVTEAHSYQTPQISTTTEQSTVNKAFELGKIIGKAEASLDIAQAKIGTGSPTNTPIASQPVPNIPTPEPTQIIMTVTPTQISPSKVPFDAPFAWFSINKKDGGIALYNASVGDIVTLTVNNEITVKTVEKVNGRERFYGFNIPNLVTKTGYTYTIKLERNNEYAVESGTFETE